MIDSKESTSIAEGKEDHGETPIKSARACLRGGQDDEEKGVSKGRRIPPPAPKFGGCPSVPLRVRDTAGKYAGDRKTETL